MRRTVLVLALDLALIVVATAGALLLRDNLALTTDRALAILPYLAATLAVAVPVLLALRLNRAIWRFSTLADCMRVLAGVGMIVFGALALGFVFNRLEGVARSLPILQALLMSVTLVGVRVFARVRHDQRQADRVRPAATRARAETVLLVGVSSLAELYLRSLEELGDGCVQVAGIVGTRPRHMGRLVRMCEVLGLPEDIEQIVGRLAVHGILVDRIVVTVPLDRLENSARDALLRFERGGSVPLEVLPARLGLRAGVAADAPAERRVVAQPAMHLDDSTAGRVVRRRYWRVKRALDVILAALLLILLAPLLAIIALLVTARMGWPAVFWQRRLGVGGTPFLVYKFRSMGPPHDRSGNRIPDEARTDRFGSFLRRSRLDEMPQLFNILLGHMSFVGPRPLLETDLPSASAVRRLVRPGLTGWAQVNGGRTVSAEDKVALDAWYVHHATLWLDFKIVLRTIPIVLFGERVDARAIREAWREMTGGEETVEAAPAAAAAAADR